uniref:Major facilitator superfamily (MFS) profile domain-containing protein n=1 Tax=Phytophthora ramorum TaxID=164328 RepID=H3GL39_PHYRM
MNGIFQIQSFYLNTIVGFNVKDFGNLMLLGGILAVLGQALLLKPLVRCFKEKGVIVIALTASMMGMGGFAASAYYPHKWLIYAMSIPGCISDLSFPAISALKSINASDKRCFQQEQGRLQGAIYGARSVFEAIGPLIFASLTSPPTKSVAAPAPLLSPTYGESPTSMYFETDDDDDETEDGDGYKDVVYATGTLDDENFLAEPLLGSSSTAAHVHTEV